MFIRNNCSSKRVNYQWFSLEVTHEKHVNAFIQNCFEKYLKICTSYLYKYSLLIRPRILTLSDGSELVMTSIHAYMSHTGLLYSSNNYHLPLTFITHNTSCVVIKYAKWYLVSIACNSRQILTCCHGPVVTGDEWFLTFIRVWWPWWRHQMKTFSALLALCEGFLPVIGEFPSQRTVKRSFDVLFDLHPNNSLTNHRDAGDLRRHRAHYDVIAEYGVVFDYLHLYYATLSRSMGLLPNR